MKAQKTTRDYVEVNIADIVSGVENLRDAVPRLTKLGYGIFNGTDKQPDSLVSLALSEDALQQAKYVKLLVQHEPNIKVLADNMAVNGLLEPIRVRPADEKGKYDLVFGARRCLAWLYNCAKSAGQIPSRMTAEVVESEGKESLLVSLSENIRAEPSPIDEAQSFQRLEKTFGMKHAEVAKAMGKDVKVVRERLKLLKLPLDIQERVHLGKLAQKTALASLTGDKDKAAPTSSDPRRLPPLKEVEKLYNTPRDQLPDEYEPLITEEVRRLFAVWLKVKYKPMSKNKKPAPLNQPSQN